MRDGNHPLCSRWCNHFRHHPQDEREWAKAELRPERHSSPPSARSSDVRKREREPEPEPAAQRGPHLLGAKCHPLSATVFNFLSGGGYRHAGSVGHAAGKRSREEARPTSPAPRAREEPKPASPVVKKEEEKKPATAKPAASKPMEFKVHLHTCSTPLSVCERA